MSELVRPGFSSSGGTRSPDPFSVGTSELVRPGLATESVSVRALVGGPFESHGSVPANGYAIAKGSSWRSRVSSGLTETFGFNAGSIVFDGVEYRYGSGSVDGNSAHLFFWDPDAVRWRDVQSDFLNVFYALLNPAGDRMIVLGQTSGSTSAVKEFDGTSFTDLAGLELENAVRHGVYFNDELHVTGNLQNFVNAAKWNGSSWSALGSGLTDNLGNVFQATGYVTELWDGKVAFGGAFEHAGGSSANNVATWNGSAWASLGSVESPNVDVRDLAVFEDDLYRVGDGNVPAVWNVDSEAWEAVTDETLFEPSSAASLLLTSIVRFDDSFVVGGTFNARSHPDSDVGRVPAIGLVRLDVTDGYSDYLGGVGTSTAILTSPDGGGVNRLVIDVIPGDQQSSLVVSGDKFVNASKGYANRAATLTSRGYTPLNGGLRGDAIGPLFPGPKRIVRTPEGSVWFGAHDEGVNLTIPDDAPDAIKPVMNTGGVAIYNGRYWSAPWAELATAVPPPFTVLGGDTWIDESSERAYAACGLAQPHLWSDDDSLWNALGSNLDAGGEYQWLQRIGGIVRIAGVFTITGDAFNSYYAELDGDDWSAINPSGMARGRHLVLGPDEVLYLGGEAASAPDNPVKKLMGGSWSDVGLSLTGTCLELLWTGGILYAIGPVLVGGSEFDLASYDPETDAWTGRVAITNPLGTSNAIGLSRGRLLVGYDESSIANLNVYSIRSEASKALAQGGLNNVVDAIA